MCENCYAKAIVEAIMEESRPDPRGIPTMEVVHALLDVAAAFIAGIPDKEERQEVSAHYAGHLEAIVEERHESGYVLMAEKEVNH